MFQYYRGHRNSLYSYGAECSAAIHVFTAILTSGGGNCKDYFATALPNICAAETKNKSPLLGGYHGQLHGAGDVMAAQQHKKHRAEGQTSYPVLFEPFRTFRRVGQVVGRPA